MAIISIDRQHQIDTKIEELRLNLDFSYPEKNIMELAEQMGISVFVLSLPPNMSGAIRYNSGRPEVYLNSNMGKERRTFTLAHEIGHLVLSHVNETTNKYRIDTFNYRNNTQESMEETEANYFAATLLVPRHKFKKLISILGSNSDSISSIAKYFGVSESVIINRLRWMKRN